MPRTGMSRVSTAYLLTCAAIGVAGGVLLAVATWVSTRLFAALPFASVAVAGLWLLPATVALRLLQRPFAGLLVGLISGIVCIPFSPTGVYIVYTNVWWAFFAEVAFLAVLYRFWKTWQHFAGALLVGILYPILAWVSFGLGSFTLPAQLAFFALTIASALAGTWLGSHRRPASGCRCRAARAPPPPRWPTPTDTRKHRLAGHTGAGAPWPANSPRTRTTASCDAPACMPPRSRRPGSVGLGPHDPRPGGNRRNPGGDAVVEHCVTALQDAAAEHDRERERCELEAVTIARTKATISSAWRSTSRRATASPTDASAKMTGASA